MILTDMLVTLRSHGHPGLLPEMRTLNVSVEGNVTSMHWAAQAPDTTYCLEWQARGQGRNHTHCTLIAPEDEDTAGMGMSLSDKYAL